MPDKVKLTRKLRKAIRHEAKTRSGYYGGRGRDASYPTGEIGKTAKNPNKDYSSTGVGDFLRDVNPFSKGKYGLKKVNNGGGQKPISKERPPKPKPPILDKASTGTRQFESVDNKGNLVEDETKRTDQSASSEKDLAQKTNAAVEKVSLDKFTDPGFKKASEWTGNTTKLSEYAKKRKALALAKATTKYVDGSRTQSQKDQDDSDERMKGQLENAGFKQGKVKRKMYKMIKGYLKDEYRKK